MPGPLAGRGMNSKERSTRQALGDQTPIRATETAAGMSARTSPHRGRCGRSHLVMISGPMKVLGSTVEIHGT